MATFVMADGPSTGINAAIRRSCEVMNGRKMELFSLEISFIGWRLLGWLLSAVTLGIGAAWAQCMVLRWETKHTIVEGYCFCSTQPCVSSHIFNLDRIPFKNPLAVLVGQACVLAYGGWVYLITFASHT